MIPFNKPHLSGNELVYIKDAVLSGHISGNGKYTKKCNEFFRNKYGFENTFLTTSCTDALEMAAILMNIKEGDEIKLYKGERHRIIGMDEYAVVAEIWIHTDKDNPSDENDIVRIQDDYDR